MPQLRSNGPILVTESPLPFWQVNVEPNARTEECPAALLKLDDKDIGILSTPDADYQAQSWAEVWHLTATNHLEHFRRVPSDLRQYRVFIYDLKQEHGSVMNFVLKYRLGWQAPIIPRGRPFEYGEDLKVLHNDWPYGIDQRIKHLIVWTKFDLEEDPETGDLSDETRRKVDGYVNEAFRAHMPEDTVIWFRNWSSLKSIHAVEHFHVMLFDPPEGFVQQVTGGDIPLSVLARQR
ncbi:N-acetylglucosamine-induced protein 1 like [Verticillium longisporum]|nr:N-acetylglucosamine-induced protein 1 like [Verticillium longisporum]KAG7109964.1 N-acetylglucosamine-induced protein 1 like [Verticillium longisporum]